MDINDDISKLHIKCEKRVHKHPALYKLALIAYILYGYAYIAFIALILLFLIIIMLFGSLVQPFAILVEFIFIPILWKILKNIFKMFIPLPLPRYSARLPDHSPLVKLAGDICEKMKIRHIDNIYLTADINASVGFYKGKASVFIGAPLMAILNNEQFETIIAHELAHIKLRHGWAARFIYHSGSYWNKLIYDMSWNSVTGMGFAFMGKFYAKFINRLNAKSLALSKYNEYIADGIAADISGGMSADKTDGKSAKINERVSADIPGGKSAGVTGRTLFAETISILHIFSYAKDVYDIWGDYFKKALTDEIPPNLFDFLAGELKKIESDEIALFYNTCLHIKSTLEDNHPSLGERLERLGAYPNNMSFPDASACAAAGLLSGDDKSIWDKHFEKWQKYRWIHMRKVLMKAKVELDDKNVNPMETTIIDEKLMPQVFMVTPYRRFMELSQINLTANPFSAYSLYIVGARKLYSGDSSGLEMLKLAFNKNERLCFEIRRVLINYFRHFCLEDEIKQFVSANKKLFSYKDGVALTTSDLIWPTDIDHRQVIPFIWDSAITFCNDALISKIKDIAAESPVLKKAYIILDTNGCVLFVSYRRGWRNGKYDDERLKMIESAKSEALMETGRHLTVLAESQIARRRRLKRSYKNYAVRIK